MCVIDQVNIPVYNQQFMKWYTLSIWIIGLFAFIYWCFELLCIRNIFRCSLKRIRHYTCCCKLKLPVAFLMILLSTFTSLLSSTFFLYSSINPSIASCLYAPIGAILLRFLSKHFIWGFNIVRGQMVIETLENKYLNKFVKHSPYILSSQMLIIFGIVIIFSTSDYDQNIQECKTDIPLVVIVCIVFIGEILYGIGFVYIFFKAMTTSMKRVINALRDTERQKTRKQLIHHLTVYLIQFLLASIYLISVATCSNSNTFTLFDIFAAELLITNICVLTLFRGRTRWWKKRCICCKNRKTKGQCSKHKVARHKTIDSTPNRNIARPVLLSTSSANKILAIVDDDDVPKLSLTQQIEESSDTLDDISTLQLSDKDTAKSPASNSRNNSISMNPLLPNSWLSPRSIKNFKRTLISNIEHELFSGRRAFSESNLKTSSEPIISSTFRHKTKEPPQSSQSASVLEISSLQSASGYNTNNEEFDDDLDGHKNLRSKSMMVMGSNDNDKDTLNALEKSATSKSIVSGSKFIFKKATQLFISNIMSQSTPMMMVESLDDLATAEPIDDIMSLSDNFRFTLSNSPKSKSRTNEQDFGVNIVYSD